MQKIVWVAGLIVGMYLIVRAIVEPFVIDIDDPATYRNDWGGPSLAGVLAVHCVPGLVATVIIITAAVRHRQSRHIRR